MKPIPSTRAEGFMTSSNVLHVFGSATLATRAVASAGPTPGIASSRLLVSLERWPSRDHAIEFKNLRLQRLQLSTKRSNACTRNLGESFVIRISDYIEQLFDALTPDRRDNAKLSKMSSDRV